MCVIFQAIFADDVIPGAETFGWSLSGGMDMDQNQYPDLLIGAYSSNKAAFLRLVHYLCSTNLDGCFS